MRLTNRDLLEGCIDDLVCVAVNSTDLLRKHNMQDIYVFSDEKRILQIKKRILRILDEIYNNI